MSFCENTECGEEFAPTETTNGFCSWECENRSNELEDEDYDAPELDADDSAAMTALARKALGL